MAIPTLSSICCAPSARRDSSPTPGGRPGGASAGSVSRVARSLKVTSTGIAVLAAGCVLLTGHTAAVIMAAASPSLPARAGHGAVQAGVLVFLTGIAYPGVAMRAVTVRAWPKDLRTFRDLGSLWTLLHRAFPDDAHPRGLAPTWAGALTPSQANRRSYRRVMKIRDWLVRISPQLDLTGAAGNDNTVLAERLVAAVTRYRSPLTPSEPVPVAIPADPGLETDATKLAHLSLAVRATLSRRQHQKEERT
jgi:hypothetical protein